MGITLKVPQEVEGLTVLEGTSSGPKTGEETETRKGEVESKEGGYERGTKGVDGSIGYLGHFSHFLLYYFGNYDNSNVFKSN